MLIRTPQGLCSMVHELVTLLHKPCGVLMNKMERPYEPLEDFCREQKLPVLARIPYSPETAQVISQGKIVSRENREMCELFRGIWEKIGGMI